MTNFVARVRYSGRLRPRQCDLTSMEAQFPPGPTPAIAILAVQPGHSGRRTTKPRLSPSFRPAS
jgi:hypothetical protein